MDAPTMFLAAAADGSWVMIAQARDDTDGNERLWVDFGYHGGHIGDELQPYLVRGAGAGEAAGRLLRWSEDHRRLLFLRGAGLVVMDVASGETVPLGSLADIELSYSYPWAGGHFWASMDDSGSTVVWSPDRRSLRLAHLDEQLRIHDRKQLEADGGWIWSADVAPDGRHLLVTRIATRPGRDAEDLPELWTSSGPEPFATGFNAQLPEGVDVSLYELPSLAQVSLGVTSGEVASILVVDGRIVASTREGHLVWRNGAETVSVGGDGCWAEPLAFHDGDLYFGCDLAEGPVFDADGPIMRWSQGTVQALDIGEWDGGGVVPPHSNLNDTGYLFASNQHGTFRALDASYEQLNAGQLSVVRDGLVVSTMWQKLIITRLDTGRSIEVSGGDDHPRLLVGGSVVLFGQRLVDLERRRVHAAPQGDPVHVASDGRVLVQERFLAPLHWKRSEPPGTALWQERPGPGASVRTSRVDAGRVHELRRTPRRETR